MNLYSVDRAKEQISSATLTLQLLNKEKEKIKETGAFCRLNIQNQHRNQLTSFIFMLDQIGFEPRLAKVLLTTIKINPIRQTILIAPKNSSVG